LQADCENCFGLCCVALPFAASAEGSDHANQVILEALMELILVVSAVGVISVLSLLTLSREFAAAGAADTTSFQASGTY
jgi:hypothetical protein